MTLPVIRMVRSFPHFLSGRTHWMYALLQRSFSVVIDVWGGVCNSSLARRVLWISSGAGIKTTSCHACRPIQCPAIRSQTCFSTRTRTWLQYSSSVWFFDRFFPIPIPVARRSHPILRAIDHFDICIQVIRGYSFIQYGDSESESWDLFPHP